MTKIHLIMDEWFRVSPHIEINIWADGDSIRILKHTTVLRSLGGGRFYKCCEASGRTCRSDAVELVGQIHLDADGLAVMTEHET